MNERGGRAINKRLLHTCGEAVLDLFYPRRCPVCDNVLPIPDRNAPEATGKYLCATCRKKIRYTGEVVCQKCGKPVETERQEYCYDCAKMTHEYEQGRAVFLYQGGIRESLYRFKYSNRREYARFYAEEAARLYGNWIAQRQIQAIVPIPLHPRKRRQRGYNQAEVFARELGRICNIPVETRLLERSVYTEPQKQLNDQERKKNLKNAFNIKENIVKLKYILVVDDIYTTGSTIDAAAKVLKDAGNEHIYFLSIGIGRGY